MSTSQPAPARPHRARWAAIGAATAVTLGTGGVGIVSATSPDGASTFIGTDPCRLLDTREGGGDLGPDDKLTITARGDVGECAGPAALPDTATALQLNVTAIGATEATNLRVYPGAGDPPNASNLNPVPGEPPTPNAVTVELDDELFSIYNRFGSVDVVVDVVGYYTDHHHDDRYYTKVQAEGLLAGKSDAGHDHDDTYAHADHGHDDRYLGIDAAAADSDLLDGMDSTAFQPTGDYLTAAEVDDLIAGPFTRTISVAGFIVREADDGAVRETTDSGFIELTAATEFVYADLGLPEGARLIGATLFVSGNLSMWITRSRPVPGDPTEYLYEDMAFANSASTGDVEAVEFDLSATGGIPMEEGWMNSIGLRMDPGERLYGAEITYLMPSITDHNVTPLAIPLDHPATAGSAE